MASSNLLGRIQTHPKPSTLALAISKVIFCALPVAQITIGAKYLHDCPREDYIPIFLIVVGIFLLIVVFISCLPSVKEPEEGPSNLLSTVRTAWNMVAIMFLFGWGIAGNVWIYTIYEPNYNKTTTDMDPYCNKTLYLFAFWTSTLGYVLFTLVLVCGFLALLCIWLCGLISQR